MTSERAAELKEAVSDILGRTVNGELSEMW
jgi:hypothetical protein